mgnify:CR=1 FL=1
MENNTELSLLRPRSVSAVVSDGYRLYMATFRSLFRSSWIAALVYALAFALLASGVVQSVIPLAVARRAGVDSVGAPAAWVSVVVVLFYFIAVVFFAAQGVHVLREHSATGAVSRAGRWYGRLCLSDFLRLLPVCVWLLLLSAAVVAAFMSVAAALASLGVEGGLSGSVSSLALATILALAAMALCIPLHYTVVRALVADGKPRLSPPFSGYATGLRHWGLLFATVLVVCVLTGLLTLVCELPAVIMAAANAMACVGQATGDPLGMPDSMAPLAVGVFFVAGFIQAYVHLSTIYPLYYAYGAIEEMKSVRLDISHTPQPSLK